MQKSTIPVLFCTQNARNAEGGVTDATPGRRPGGRTLLPMALPENRRSTLDRADDALLIVVAVIAVVAFFGIVHWIVGTVLFVARIAIATVVVVAIVRFLNRDKH